MKLKLSYARSYGPPADLMLTTEAQSTVEDLARAIAGRDPLGPQAGATTLQVASPGSGSYVTLDPAMPVADSPLASGCDVRLAPSELVYSPPAQNGGRRATLVAQGGPDGHVRVDLATGTHVVGRGADADVVLTDPAVSKRHVRIEVGRDVELVDLNSANGIEVDGRRVARWRATDGKSVVVGDTHISVEVHGGDGPTSAHGQGARGGRILFNRSPRVEDRFAAVVLPRPQVPSELDRQPFPWLLMLVPMILGAVTFSITRSPLSLIIVAMAPMMLLANFWMARQRRRRQQDSEVSRFESQFEALEAKLAHRRPEEHRLRTKETSSLQEAFEAGLGATSSMWTRRPEHWNFLHLRLGTAEQPSRTTVAPAPGVADGLVEYSRRLEELEERYRTVSDVPLTEDLRLSGALGVAGEGDVLLDYARGLMLQLVSGYSPAELVLAATVPPESVAAFDWLTWVPHTTSAHSPLMAPHLADSTASAEALVAVLEDLVDERGNGTASAHTRFGALPEGDSAVGAGATVGAGTSSEVLPSRLPIVVLLVHDGAPVERGRLVQLAERGPACGVHVIWVARRLTDLPAACRTVVEVPASRGAALVHLVRHGVRVDGVRIEGISADRALLLARRISCYVDSGAVVADDSDLPGTVSVLTVLGDDLARNPSSVLDRWIQNDSIVDRDPGPHAVGERRRTKRVGGLQAFVGRASGGDLLIDLRTHGPHALVGGTTGAGKSEFLQSWIVGMAAENSPDRLTFLLVDYKGGSAFAECERLPHCVGVVTDLNPYLVTRVLDSLTAEVKKREELFYAKKVKDIVELEQRRDPMCPPALVVVIDEFAVLDREMPQFVEGVVDIAQRGRSLGIHLIMATQRPAGVIKPNLRANTNLRIALRMAEEADSVDVVGTDAAALLDPGLPGRGVAKLGPGRLRPFQAAYAGGWRDETAEGRQVTVQELRFGAESLWVESQPDADLADPGSTDLQRLVESCRRAAVQAGLTAAPRPWLDALAPEIDLSRDPAGDADRLPFGVADQPKRQRQDAVYFEPERDANLAVFGATASGKSVALRTMAAAAGLASRAAVEVTGGGGPWQVYGIDYTAGGLTSLDVLPHVGGIASGRSRDQVVSLLRLLERTVAERRERYPAHGGEIAAYRRATGRVESRLLLLVDGFPAFRADFENQGSKAVWYEVFLNLLTEGRAMGVHVVLTADRPVSVSGTVLAAVSRRVVLRMSDETAYASLGVPSSIVSSASPPGRGVVGRLETQVAILGGSGDAADQARELAQLATDLRRHGIPEAPPLQTLPMSYPFESLPTAVDDRPVLGLWEETLAPVTFDPRGVFVVSGPSGSGRSNALSAVVASLRTFEPGSELWYVANRPSVLAGSTVWHDSAVTADTAAELVRALEARLEDQDFPRMVVVVEGINDFLGTAADRPLQDLLRAVKRTDHLVVVEGEAGVLGQPQQLYSEVKASRHGLVLQPSYGDGEALMRTTFPRVTREEFPRGRGLFVEAGVVRRIQLPLVRERLDHTGRPDPSPSVRMPA